MAPNLTFSKTPTSSQPSQESIRLNLNLTCPQINHQLRSSHSQRAKTVDIFYLYVEYYSLQFTVRDGWERKKEGFESQLTTLLGVPWTFEINPLVVYPYAEEGSYGHGSLGDCIHA